MRNNQKMKKLAFILLSVSMNAVAGDIRNIYFVSNDDNKSCLMTEFGSAVIANPINLKGKYSGPDHCAVHLTYAEFEKRFDFCAVGGIDISRPQSPLECTVRYSSNEWVEFVQRGENKCEFVCKTK